MSPPNHGKRLLVTLDGDPYYVIVTTGPDGRQVDCICALETSEPDPKMRRAIDILCAAINYLSAEVDHADA